MTKSKNERLVVVVSRELGRQLRRALASRKGVEPKTTKSDLIRESIRVYLGNRDGTPQMFETLAAKSVELERKAVQLMQSGEPAEARKAYLLAIASEAEALACLSSPAEGEIKTALIRIISMLKNASGYTYLPDVPSQITHNPTASA